MPRPPRHPTDLDLLNAVRAQLAADPDISQAELRDRVGGTQSVVSAALRAALVEVGRGKAGDVATLDPRFAVLIRMPEPPAPLDLRTAVPATLGRAVAEHLMALTGVVDQVVERVHEAALAEMRREQDAAKALIEDADRRAARAETFVDSLRRETAEAEAEAERVRAEAARELGTQALKLSHLAREISDSHEARARAEEALKATMEDLSVTKRALTTAHDEQVLMTRELAVSNARVQELERHVSDLRSRLDRADAELASARSAESDARSHAASALAKLQLQGELLHGSAGRSGRIPKTSSKLKKNGNRE